MGSIYQPKRKSAAVAVLVRHHAADRQGRQDVVNPIGDTTLVTTRHDEK
jgi:hypothetical protein